MTWVKGRSGNARGRPPLGEELAPSIRRELRRRDPVTGLQNKRAIAQVLVAKAVAGDIEAIREILNRVDGKVPTPVEHSGPDGGRIGLELAAFDYLAVVADLAPPALEAGPNGHHRPPGEAARRGDGQEMGQDADGG